MLGRYDDIQVNIYSITDLRIRRVKPLVRKLNDPRFKMTISIVPDVNLDELVQKNKTKQ